MNKKIDQTVTIKEFYKGRDILITGGLGFVGKVLLEKLLRSCNDINRIYVLVRAKRDKTPQQRLDTLLSESIFDIVRSKYPQQFKKVVVVNGDVTLDGLGLNENDIDLTKDVSVIFHSAATVRFNEPIKQAILTNTKGTYEVMEFARNLSDIKAIIHVSTTYCNLDQMHLEEKVYPAYANWRDMIDAALKNDTKTLNSFAASNIKLHNSYTLSKHLAEQVANDYRNILPVVVFRPAVVSPTLFDPVPGWVDSWNGPIGVSTAIGMGVVRTFYANPNYSTEYTPVDTSARCMIVAAYAMGTNQARTSDLIPVYNCSKPYSINKITKIGLDVLKQNPMQKTLWAPDGTMTSNPFYFHLRFFLFQLLPALVVDVVLLAIRQKPFLLKLQKTIYKASVFIAPFVNTQWIVSTNRVSKLDSLIPSSEYDEFAFYEAMNVDLSKYIKTCIEGIKVYLLKEPVKCSKATLMKYKMMVVADTLLRLMFYGCILYVLYHFTLAKIF